MRLYEITTIDGQMVEPAVTIKEAAQMLNRTVGSLYQAAIEGRTVNEKYVIESVDNTLSKTVDMALLADYDGIRQLILKRGKR